MPAKRKLIDANEFHAYLEDVRQTYLEEDTFSSNFAAEVIETVQDEYLAKAPTVDAVEVVHGEWIADEDGIDEDGNGQYRCSVCGVGDKHNPTVIVSYCWNCGTKMDGDSRKESEA